MGPGRLLQACPGRKLGRPMDLETALQVDSGCTPTVRLGGPPRTIALQPRRGAWTALRSRDGPRHPIGRRAWAFVTCHIATPQSVDLKSLQCSVPGRRSAPKAWIRPVRHPRSQPGLARPSNSVSAHTRPDIDKGWIRLPSSARAAAQEP